MNPVTVDRKRVDCYEYRNISKGGFMKFSNYLKPCLLILLGFLLLAPVSCETAKSAGHVLADEAKSLMFWKKQKPYLESDYLIDQDVRDIGGHEYVRIKNPDYGQRIDAPQFIWVEKDKYLKTYFGVEASPSGKKVKEKPVQVGSLPPPPPQYLVENAPPSTPASSPGAQKSTSGAAQQAGGTKVMKRMLKRKILLLSFKNNTGEPVDFVVDAVYTAIKNRLLNSDEVILVERSAMQKYLQRQGLSLASLSDKTVLIHAGEDLGVQGFFFGSIDRLLLSHSTTEEGKEQAWATIALRINLIDARTASLVVSAKGSNNLYKTGATGPGCRIRAVKAAVNQALKEALPPILKECRNLPWETRIIKVDGKKIYIDSGRDTGLRVGDVLKVYQKGTDIVIPSTRIIVGRQNGPLLGKIQVIDFFGLDAAIAVAKEGDDFKKGDIVMW